MRVPPPVVLGVAAVLTGGGQVLNREPGRGLAFVLFALTLGSATWLTAPPEATFAGRIAGGLFVHAMAMLDAYRHARAAQG